MTLGLGMSFLLGHPDLPVIIQFSTEGANLLLVAQGRPLIGDRVAYRAQGAQVL